LLELCQAHAGTLRAGNSGLVQLPGQRVSDGALARFPQKIAKHQSKVNAYSSLQNQGLPHLRFSVRSLTNHPPNPSQQEAAASPCRMRYPFGSPGRPIAGLAGEAPTATLSHPQMNVCPILRAFCEGWDTPTLASNSALPNKPSVKQKPRRLTLSQISRKASWDTRNSHLKPCAGHRTPSNLVRKAADDPIVISS
jgi:hypothetical protein